MIPTCYKLLQACKELVEEFPDFVYSKPYRDSTTCSYTLGGDARYPDNVGCIVGQAYKRLTGKDVPDAYDDASVADLVGSSLLAIGKTDVENEKFLNKLILIQERQDLGERWVDSMDAAKLLSD